MQTECRSCIRARIGLRGFVTQHIASSSSLTGLIFDDDEKSLMKVVVLNNTQVLMVTGKSRAWKGI